MTKSLTLLMVAGVAAVVSATAPMVSTTAPVDDAFARFWASPTTVDASVAAAGVVRSGVSFDEARRRLAQGRPYPGDVKRGVVKASRQDFDDQFPYTLDVPASYDPATKYQVRVQLHGGVGRPDAGARGDGSIGSLRGAEQIYVLPQAWAGAPWWGAPQLANVAAILDHVKRTYNVDENRVVLSGVSDGGTGTYFMAMRDTTPFAGFLPLNGFILVLNNRSLRLDGALYPHNLTNKPFFVVNGGEDPLYPAAEVTPLMTSFAANGLDVVYRPQAQAAHNTSWWPDLKNEIEAWVSAHPRQPHPAHLSWQTDDAGASNRAHWLVIDRLRPTLPAADLPDINLVTSGEEANFGVRSSGMRVAAVLPGSNAAAFGLLPGDLVTSINDRALPAALELTEFLGIYEPGLPLHFVVTRGSATVHVRGTYQPTVRQRVAPLFAAGPPGGRVDVARQGNTVRAVTRGVAGFTLLLSPDVFDFAAPITVVADGATVFSRQVAPSVATLLKWAARDNDRTMLYGAELPISVPPAPAPQRGR
ncbi:MAG: hypothetical protein ABI880_13375 [Acidobacteriota bacterium]